MELDYFFFYLEASIVCTAILVILLIHDKRYNTRQEKQIWFNRTIIAHILYILSDVVWAGVISGHLPQIRFLTVSVNLVNYVLLSLMVYDWFIYTAVSEDMKDRNTPRFRRLALLPMGVSVLALITVYLVSPYSWVSESGELGTWYYPMMLCAPVLYLSLAFISSMKKARHARSREERRLYRLLGCYPMAILFFGLIQTFALKAPLFCFGCTIMLMYFYLQNMQMMVSVDSLTRLNNRGQIDRYMDQARFGEGTKVHAMMIDVNRFKKINDTWGHAEGDKALILVASALKKAAGRIGHPAFLGRYGGDEFSIFLQGNAEEKDLPAQAVGIIREVLQEEQKGKDLPYVLEISAGYDTLGGKDDTLEACLQRADAMLYETKRREGTAR